MPDEIMQRLYLSDDARADIRKLMLAHLRRAPAEMTAHELVDTVHQNGGAKYQERDLMLELSRMLGALVRMNANRTLSAR